MIAALALVAYDGLSTRIEKLAGSLDRLGAETIDAIAMTAPISAPTMSVASAPALARAPHLSSPKAQRSKRFDVIAGSPRNRVLTSPSFVTTTIREHDHTLVPDVPRAIYAMMSTCVRPPGQALSCGSNMVICRRS